jgi:hypothetical protein
MLKINVQNMQPAKRAHEVTDFISGKFHRSLKPKSRFNFINVAIWENEDVYWKAYEKNGSGSLSRRSRVLRNILLPIKHQLTTDP